MADEAKNEGAGTLEGEAEGDPLVALSADPGLCRDCRHAQIIGSKRAAYLRCGYSDLAPNWPRYPSLPVLHCEHYRAFDLAREDSSNSES